MVRKRISDLLNEEAQKPLNSNETVIEVTAEEVVDAETEESADTHHSTHVKTTNPTKGELEATVDELRAELDLAHEKQGSLQQQIIELKSDLDERKALVKKLQKEADRVNSIKEELEQAKKAAIKLAETNTKLMAELDALKKEAETNTKLMAEVVVKPEKQVKQQSNQTYQKSWRPLEDAPQQQSKDTGDFASNTWLLD